MENVTGHEPHRPSRKGILTAIRDVAREMAPLGWVGLALLALSTGFAPGALVRRTLETYLTDQGLTATVAEAYSLGLRGGLEIASSLCLLLWMVVAWRDHRRQGRRLRASAA